MVQWALPVQTPRADFVLNNRFTGMVALIAFAETALRPGEEHTHDHGTPSASRVVWSERSSSQPYRLRCLRRSVVEGGVRMDSVVLPLSGRVAVVTGASSGLGRATAIALAASGADVALLARSPVDLEAARAEIETMGRSATPGLVLNEAIVSPLLEKGWP